MIVIHGRVFFERFFIAEQHRLKHGDQRMSRCPLRQTFQHVTQQIRANHLTPRLGLRVQAPAVTAARARPLVELRDEDRVRVARLGTARVVDRRAWFEPPMQRFLDFCRSPAFASRAEELDGYDILDFGKVHFNGP